MGLSNFGPRKILSLSENIAFFARATTKYGDNVDVIDLNEFPTI